MGTSKSFGGPSGTNPLIPSWLVPPPELAPSDLLEPFAPLPATPDQPATNPATTPAPAQPDPSPVEVPVDVPTRYKTSRTRFNRIARGTHSNRGRLRKATSDYVRKGLGGSRRASSRMAVSAKTAGRVIGFIRSVEEKGFVQAAKDFGLGDLTGKTAKEIGPLLAEAFLEQGGSIDEGISNRAWVETVIEAIEGELVDTTDISADTMIVMLENYVTRTIELRLQQDIGAKILPLSSDAARAKEVKTEIRELVRGEVQRAVRPILQATARVEQSRLSSVGLRIYRQAFEYLQQLPTED